MPHPQVSTRVGTECDSAAQRLSNTQQHSSIHDNTQQRYTTLVDTLRHMSIATIDGNISGQGHSPIATLIDTLRHMSTATVVYVSMSTCTSPIDMSTGTVVYVSTHVYSDSCLCSDTCLQRQLFMYRQFPTASLSDSCRWRHLPTAILLNSETILKGHLRTFIGSDTGRY